MAGLQREYSYFEMDRRSRTRKGARQGNADRLDPHYKSICVEGSSFSPEKFDELQAVDRQNWKSEVMEHEGLFIALHDHLPPEMIYERELLICRR